MEDVILALPAEQPTLRVVPMPSDVNQAGDIFGGWVMSQVDIAGVLQQHGSHRAALLPWRRMPFNSGIRFPSAISSVFMAGLRVSAVLQSPSRCRYLPSEILSTPLS